MEISSDQDTVRLGATRASIDEQLAEKEGRYRADLVSQDSVARHQREALVARESLIRRQLDQVGEQVALQAEEVEGSQALLERIEPLGKGGYISAFEIQRQQAVVRAARSGRQNCSGRGSNSSNSLLPPRSPWRNSARGRNSPKRNRARACRRSSIAGPKRSTTRHTV